MSKSETFAIIGGGQAGGRAARELRTNGFKGRIIIFCAEKHLPYERPSLSKSLLLDPTSPVSYVATADEYAELSIELQIGIEVLEINRKAKILKLDNGNYLKYDKLLISTGSRLRRIHIDGLEDDKIVYLRTLDDCRHLEKQLRDKPSITVVGGGFIGLEVAATAKKLGCKVTVVEFADRLLPRLGCNEISQKVLQHHKDNGIDIRLSSKVLKMIQNEIYLEDGAKIETDIVIAGIGVAPETQLAESAGIIIDDGIVINKFCQTSDSNIYAAGDVARLIDPQTEENTRLESWQNANIQAEISAMAMLGTPKEAMIVPWVWSDQGDLNIQIAGKPNPIAKSIIRSPNDESNGITVFQINDEKLVSAITVNRNQDMVMARRLLAKEKLSLPLDELSNPNISLRQFIR